MRITQHARRIWYRSATWHWWSGRSQNAAREEVSEILTPVLLATLIILSIW